VTRERSDGADGALDEETRADAIGVVRDAREWRLTEARWVAIGPVVHELAAAVREGRADAAREAVAGLELLGPVRAKRLGDPPTVPAPEPIREEINELVDTLDGRVQPPS
jgi:hypothetical protein